MGSDIYNLKARESSTTVKQSKAKATVLNKKHARLDAQPLLIANPQAALPMLEMIGQAQLSIDDLLGQLSRQFIEQLLVLSAETVADAKHPGRQALARLMSRSFADMDIVAVYLDGIIVASHHIIAAVGVDAQGAKHVLGLASGSSENAKVVKDLLGALAERGVDLNEPRLWVIDGSKALRSAIEQRCGDAAKVQRCRIHKIRNVTQRLPKDKAQQVRWVMTQAFKLDKAKGKGQRAKTS